MTPGALTGRRILVTRRPEQSATLASGLRERGATVIEIPLIAIAPPEDGAPLDAALEHLADYHWIAFTSANAVHAVIDRLRALSLPLWLPPIASVGPATSSALREHLPTASIEREPATDYRAERLLAAFDGTDVAQQRFLLPVSDRARDVLADGLTSRGARVDRVVAYRTIAPPESAAALQRALADGIDVLTFASPSAVENFAELAPGRVGVRAAVIGPVTEARARALGLDVIATAQPATAQGLIDALLHALR
jgi:uroporphyrinogen-III synthase